MIKGGTVYNMSEFAKSTSQLLRSWRQPMSRPAWDGVWRRLFTTSKQYKSGSPQPLSWHRSTPLNTFTRRVSPSNTATSARLGDSRRGFRFSAWRRGGQSTAQQADNPTSLAGKMRKLSREYGWSALGVYLGLSVLDLPFCFLLVRVVGVETIGKSSDSFLPYHLRSAVLMMNFALRKC